MISKEQNKRWFVKWKRSRGGYSGLSGWGLIADLVEEKGGFETKNGKRREGARHDGQAQFL
jgi:hypothetical protein